MVVTIFAWIGVVLLGLLILFLVAGIAYHMIKEWQISLVILICAAIVFGGFMAIDYLLSK